MNETTYQIVIESLVESIKKLKVDNTILKYENERIKDENESLKKDNEQLREFLTPCTAYEEKRNTSND